MHNFAKSVDRQAQKGLCSGHAVHWRMVTTQTDTGVQHHPKVTKQGTPGTGKPVTALWTKEGGQAVCCSGVGCPKKPMPSGKPKDMLTWGGYTGRLGYWMSKGLMAHVSDVVKTERSMNVRLWKRTRQVTAIRRFGGCGADDNSLYAQEPDEAKVSRPVL